MGGTGPRAIEREIESALLVMYLARKRSGLTLRGIGDALGGVEYKNVSKAVRRFEDSLANHSNRRKIARSLLSQVANGET